MKSEVDCAYNRLEALGTQSRQPTATLHAVATNVPIVSSESVRAGQPCRVNPAFLARKRDEPVGIVHDWQTAFPDTQLVRQRRQQSGFQRHLCQDVVYDIYASRKSRTNRSDHHDHGVSGCTRCAGRSPITLLAYVVHIRSHLRNNDVHHTGAGQFTFTPDERIVRSR